jgi:predicted MFS family arabinose efflux permease
MGTARPGPHYAWVIVWLGHLNIFSALGLGRFSYAMILPSMKEGLQLTYAETGWLATGNFVGYLVASLIAGLAASRWLPRRLLLLTLLGLAASLAATAAAGGFVSALLARTLTGLASGSVYIPAMSLPNLWFAPHRRAMAAGMQTGGSGLGLIASGLVVPWILAWAGPEGWRHAWLFLAGLVVLVWLLTAGLLRNRPEDIGALPLGATQAPPPPATGRPAWREVFANPDLWALGGIFACFGVSYVVYVTFFAAHLAQAGNLSPEAAGRLWGFVGLLSLVSGLLWGMVADRIGKLAGLAIVFALHATAFAAFALARTAPAFLASVVLFGLSAWSIPAIMAASVPDYVGTRLAPAGLGFITIVFGVGQAVGPPVAGRLADWTGSFAGAYLLASGMALVGAVAALLLRARQRTRRLREGVREA